MSHLLNELQEAHRESPSWRLFGLCHQAATRIADLEEQLAEKEAENERLRAAIKPFARAGFRVIDERPDAPDAVPFSVMVDEHDDPVISLTWGDLRRACEALGGK